MRVTEPRTLLLLLSEVLALTETWAGEGCGVRRNSLCRRSQGTACLGRRTAREDAFLWPRDQTHYLVPVRLTLCPFRASSPLLSPSSLPPGPLPSRTPPLPVSPTGHIHLGHGDPRPKERRPGWQPLGPRGPLLEVLPYFGIASWPREGPLSICRLLGRHSVRKIQQRNRESEGGAAGAVDGAGGAGVLGQANQHSQRTFAGFGRTCRSSLATTTTSWVSLEPRILLR